ncbi:MAG: Hsp20/alpha crystallin family protein [Verrucomicrobiota bacterium]
MWNDPFAEFENLFSRTFGPRAPGLFERTAPHSFRLDLYAEENGYHVVAELPGVPKEAIEVKLENAVLTIAGEQRTREGDKTPAVKFSRSITVGDDIAADKVTAKLEHGLLTVDLPKAEDRKPRAITVS